MKDKVLLIENCQEMLDNAAELLHLAGYSVQTAGNGIEGLMRLKTERPEIILCDIVMPGLDGYGVLRAVRNMPELAGVPFIFMTAKAEKKDFRKGMDLGADDYLIKPFSGEDLLRVVEARLEKSRQAANKNGSAGKNITELVRETKNFLQLAMFSRKRETKKFRKKDMIFMEGDSGTHLFFVLAGKEK
ncbi:MAG TPA: response regulator [Bacteroidia bacterium]|nr:response regulator [Bacteroidia bacterium]